MRTVFVVRCAGVAHMMGKEEEHHIAQLRHEGTRVIPVFVLALENHPEDCVLSNRSAMQDS